jgi:alkylation response protein AidB-like acyl-CoA dehydrogenase
MATDAQVPAVSDLPERARVVAQLAAAHAAAADAEGQVTDEVIEALHEEGLVSMWIPRSVGGHELEVLPSIEVIEALSYGDPSVGWVHFATGLITATSAAYLGDEAVAELFRPGERVPLIAGQGTRPGTAVTTDGGHVLTGSWSFGSGIKHASYTHNLALVAETGEPRIFCTRVDEVDLKRDSWNVLGLRATGSIDYDIDGVFVGDQFSHFAGQTSSPRGGALYHLGIIGFVTLGHAAWAMGLGRRLLDELLAKVQAKAGRAGAQAESDHFLEGLQQAEARLRSARALVQETWGDVSETFARGDELSTQQNTLMRLTLSNATWSLHEVAQFVYTAAGTSALFDGTIQKLFRDVHAGTQHITSGPGVRQNVGRALGGLAEGKHWMFLDLG